MTITVAAKRVRKPKTGRVLTATITLTAREYAALLDSDIANEFDDDSHDHRVVTEIVRMTLMNQLVDDMATAPLMRKYLARRVDRLNQD